MLRLLHFIAKQWQPQLTPEASLLHRGLGSTSHNINHFSARQKHVQQCLALASASISLFSALITFYWFVRMKRSFRHFRALWYLVSSALVLSRGPMTLRPKFCEASGFFIEFSIEASGIFFARTDLIL